MREVPHKLVMKLQIACPWHTKIETVRLPGRFGIANFEGETMCGRPDDPSPMSVRLRQHDVVYTELRPVMAH